MTLLIRGGRVFHKGRLVEASILCEGGKITQVGKRIAPDGAKVINASGKAVLPGIIDSHVHFREPGNDHKEDWRTGSRAAAKGGVTTVLDMPNNVPSITTIRLLEKKRKIARSKSIVNFGLHFGATNSNISEIRKVTGVPGVKVIMGETTGDLLVDDDGSLYRVFETLAERDMLAVVHAENSALMAHFTEEARKMCIADPIVHTYIRQNICAAEAASRAAMISKIAGNRMHLTHVSTRQELHVLGLARGRITADATPHHLFMRDKDMTKLGNFAKVNPPLRSEEDRQSLWHAIHTGTIQIIATDHAPHLPGEKGRGYWDAPAGMPGVETMLPLLLNEVNNKALSLEQVVELTSQNPARIYGIPNKGAIAEGYDADLTLVDMGLKRMVSNTDIVSKCGWTQYAGRELRGWPVQTIVNGRLAYDCGELMSHKGKEIAF